MIRSGMLVRCSGIKGGGLEGMKARQRGYGDSGRHERDLRKEAQYILVRGVGVEGEVA